MKWIKASERLPEEKHGKDSEKDIVVIKVTRCDQSVYYGHDNATGIKWLMHPVGNGSTVEWLDESESSPSTVWPGEESILYFMDWVIKNVWFDNDEYYIKGSGFTTYSKPELLEYFKEQNPYWIKSPTAPDQPEQFSREDMEKAFGAYYMVQFPHQINFHDWITEYLKNKK